MYIYISNVSHNFSFFLLMHTCFLFLMYYYIHLSFSLSLWIINSTYASDIHLSVHKYLFFIIYTLLVSVEYVLLCTLYNLSM